MTALTEFVFPAPARRSAAAIVIWWERRRPAYNAWVGTAGMVSLTTVSLYAAVIGDADFFPGALAVSAAFGVMANVCYCLGPVAELLVEKIWGRRVLPVGPALYRMGLTFSVGLALFPAMLTGLLAAARLALAGLGIPSA